ncbi:MAG: DUF975 family protein [Lachnospiraceae bacterium]|nr:DUF975 family protein [Lachnospiraceae bacterium]
MMLSADFRDKAWKSLNDHWGVAVGTGFVAGLLGARTAFYGGFSFSNNSDKKEEELENILDVFLSNKMVMLLLAVVGILITVLLIYSIIIILVGGPITLGYVRFNMGMVNGHQPEFADLFSQFHRYKEAFFLQLLRGLIVTVGAILLVIPGIIANYCLALTPYILYENPGMPVLDVLKASNEMMKGNKWRLFCLHFSFVPLALVCVIFTFGIGLLWLVPYIEASQAVFYEEIKREKFVMSSGSEY